MTLWQTVKNNPSVVTWAVIVHIAVFIAIGVSFKSSDNKVTSTKQVKVIEAVAIDEKKINAEINKLKKADKRKKTNQKKLQDKASKAKKDRKKEERKLRALKKKQKEQEAINKKKRIKENKRLADVERKQKETQEKIDKLEKQRKEKQTLLEKEEKERQEKIAAKERLIQQKQQAQEKGAEVQKYQALIKSKVTAKWIIPASYQTGMKCEVLVRLIPSGDVVSVYISKSSGNSVFDRSVEQAVKKSSPLPLPAASKNLFDEFREVRLVFSPNA